MGPQAALRFVVREMEAAGESWKALKKALRRRQHHQQQQRGQAQLLLSDSPGVPFTLQAAGHTEPLIPAAATPAAEAGFSMKTTLLHPVLLSLDGSQAAAAAAAVAQKLGGHTGRAAVRELMSHPVMLPECSEGSFTDC